MELSAQELEQFDRDGFLVFPDLFSRHEVAILRREVARLGQVQADEVVREHTGGVRTIFRVHENDGPTRSRPFRALVHTPRLLRPVQQVLKDDAVYAYHTKINAKPAIEGTVWQWHQDYGSWQRDGCARPDMATFNLTMTDTTEMGGALYIIPGSHKLGRLEPFYDESTAYKFWAIPRQRIIEVLKGSPEPMAITARAGTCVLFHCNVLHASCHNLSAEDRWHIYVSCNTVANKPQLDPDARPDWVVSRNWQPLRIEDDQGVLKAA
jgi:ectoine hydroxylase